jgi:hypothetical protein
LKLGWLVLTGVLVFGGRADATISNWVINGFVFSSPTVQIHSPGTYSGDDSFVTVDITPFPSISAVTHFGARDSVTATIIYSFEYDYIGSDTPDGTIPVSFDVTLDATGSVNGGRGTALFELDGDTQASVACNYFFTCDPSHFNGTLTFQLTPNTAHQVIISAEADAPGPGNGGSSAFADPIIYLDPTFTNAANYALTLSSGIGNQAPVPEPASFLMMGVGVAGLVWRLRRRRAD